MCAHEYLYGPVPSRRLGMSLGVDVIPPKHCSYDCIYCQLGPTRTLTTERVEFFPVEEVLGEIERRLLLPPPPDVITIAGSGEPTLYSGLGTLLEGIRRLTHLPVALLTNGALFHLEEVRDEAGAATLVLPSLDAGDGHTFRRVNRPVAGLSLDQVVTGLSEFRRRYRGQIWLEVMVLPGITDEPATIAAVARQAGRISPDKIQLNTPVRPAWDDRVAPVPELRLRALCSRFTPQAEVIAEFRPLAEEVAGRRVLPVSEVTALLRRRPCTAEDICAGLGFHPSAVLKALAVLEATDRVRRITREGRVFYDATPEERGGPDPGERGLA